MDFLAPDLIFVDLNILRINIEEVSFGNQIGEGEYAEVHQAQWHGMNMAFKKIRFPDPDLLDEGDAKFFNNQFSIMIIF